VGSFYKLIIMLGICCVFTLAIANPFNQAVSVNTLSNHQTEITFSLPELKVTEQTLADQTFHVIEATHAFYTADAGLPELPHYSAVIGIPIGSKVSLANITQSEPRYISELHIAPVQDTNQTNYSFDCDVSFYKSLNTATCYPEGSYSLGEVSSIRDLDFVTIKIFPLRYFPAERKVEVIDSFHITVEHIPTSNKPTFQRNERLSKAFEPLYENLISNYQQIRTPDPQYQEQSILILYGGVDHSQFFTTTLNNIINL